MSDSPAAVRPTHAAWSFSHPWLSAIGFALVPVALTAMGSAAGQVLAVNEATAALLVAVGASASACIGMIVMWRSRQPYRSYGFRAPRNARVAWWFAPPALTIVLVALTGGVSPPFGATAAYLVLAIAVAINEEIWFRGVILSVLRPAGVRVAIISTSLLFGVFHLANLASGADPIMTLLQVAFAMLFGVVAVELVIVTGSLWPVLLWHFAWNFTSYLGGNSAKPLALVGIGLSCAVMLIYAVRLWRHVVDMKA